MAQLQAGAEDGAPVDLHHLDIVIPQDRSIDPQLPEFILDDPDPAALQSLQKL